MSHVRPPQHAGWFAWPHGPLRLVQIEKTSPSPVSAGESAPEAPSPVIVESTPPSAQALPQVRYLSTAQPAIGTRGSARSRTNAGRTTTTVEFTIAAERATTLHGPAHDSVHLLVPSRGREARASGAVILVARAIARKASYEWQCSTDRKGWVRAEPTFECKTELFGLTGGARHYVRFRAGALASPGKWSQAVSFIVA